MTVAGSKALEESLLKGHFSAGIERDVLDDDERLINFQFEPQVLVGRVDQCGNPVPADLVLLEHVWIDLLDFEYLNKIQHLDWYLCKNRIFVSADRLTEAIGQIVDFTTPEEAGITNEPVFFVDRVLHRWSVVDGWYHA